MKENHFKYLDEYFRRFLNVFPGPWYFWGYTKKTGYPAPGEGLPFSVAEKVLVSQRGKSDGWWRLEGATRVQTERFSCWGVYATTWTGKFFVLHPADCLDFAGTPPPPGALPPGARNFYVNAVSSNHGANVAVEFPGVEIPPEKTLTVFSFVFETRENDKCEEQCV